MKKRASNDTIMKFIDVVYPGVEDLAASCFGEEEMLSDATAIITDLRAEKKEIEEQLTRFREKLDRKTLAKIAYEHMFPDRGRWEYETDEHLLSNYLDLAENYIKYLTD